MQFVLLPEDPEEPGYHSEYVNLNNIDFIERDGNEVHIYVHFSSGETRNYYGARAKKLMRKLNKLIRTTQ